MKQANYTNIANHLSPLYQPLVRWSKHQARPVWSRLCGRHASSMMKSLGKKEHVLFGAFHKWRYNYTPSSLDGLVQNKITIDIYIYTYIYIYFVIIYIYTPTFTYIQKWYILFLENPKQKWLTGVAL